MKPRGLRVEIKTQKYKKARFKWKIFSQRATCSFFFYDSLHFVNYARSIININIFFFSGCSSARAVTTGGQRATINAVFAAAAAAANVVVVFIVALFQRADDSASQQRERDADGAG